MDANAVPICMNAMVYTSDDLNLAEYFFGDLQNCYERTPGPGYSVIKRLGTHSDGKNFVVTVKIVTTQKIKHRNNVATNVVTNI